jgi:hypothetical protein
MFSLIQKSLAKARSFTTLSNRVEALEKRLIKLEENSTQYDVTKLFREEMERQEEEAFQALQEELNDAIVRSMKPLGEA